jgi:hypothetical protein
MVLASWQHLDTLRVGQHGGEHDPAKCYQEL